MFGRKAEQIRRLEIQVRDYRRIYNDLLHKYWADARLTQPQQPPPPGNIWQIPTQGRRP